MKRFWKAALAAALCTGLCACSDTEEDIMDASTDPDPDDVVTMQVAAAASLETVFEYKIIPLFEAQCAGVEIEGVYDGSGKLVTQIENGLDAGVFVSAATKQMDILVDEGYVDADAVVDLVENQLVLIKTRGSDVPVSSLEDILNADVIALGDPEYVPAGEYARQALEHLGIYDEALARATLGSSVSEVLSWVESGSAQVGLVYATDAAGSDGVEVIAPVDASLLDEQVIYPAAVLKDAPYPGYAQKFMEFLQSDAAMKVLEQAGFVRA